MEFVNKLLVVAVSSLVLLSCFSMEAAAQAPPRPGGTKPLNHRVFKKLFDEGISASEAALTPCFKRLGTPAILATEASCLTVCKDAFNASSWNFKVALKDYETESWYQNVNFLMNDTIAETNKCQQCYTSKHLDERSYQVVKKSVEHVTVTSHKIMTMLYEANLGQEKDD